MPASKLPARRPTAKNSRNSRTSSSETGRRYARRANVPRISSAQGPSSAEFVGRQLNTRGRGSMSSAPPAPPPMVSGEYGPPMSTLSSAIRSTNPRPVPNVHTGNRAGATPSTTDVRLTNETPTTCVPAVAGNLTRRVPSASLGATSRPLSTGQRPTGNSASLAPSSRTSISCGSRVLPARLRLTTYSASRGK